MSWRWITKAALVILHDESLAEHGGGTGLRDEGLLDSALARPLNLVAYAGDTDPPDVAALAACYGFGLAKNHPFVDGNKRAAFLATGLFLYLNGFRLTASQADATMTVLGIASGDLSEAYFANWLRQNMAPRTTRKATK
jgi:death on curing protein